MYTNISTLSYLESKSSHLLHKHKQAKINCCLPNCWAYSPTTMDQSHHLLSWVHHQLFSSTRNGRRTNTSFPIYREFSLLRGNVNGRLPVHWTDIPPVVSARRIWELQNVHSLCKFGGTLFYRSKSPCASVWSWERCQPGLKPLADLSKSTRSKQRDQNKLVQSRPYGCDLRTVLKVPFPPSDFTNKMLMANPGVRYITHKIKCRSCAVIDVYGKWVKDHISKEELFLCLIWQSFTFHSIGSGLYNWTYEILSTHQSFVCCCAYTSHGNTVST
jgi:hypothetical protein